MFFFLTISFIIHEKQLTFKPFTPYNVIQEYTKGGCTSLIDPYSGTELIVPYSCTELIVPYSGTELIVLYSCTELIVPYSGTEVNPSEYYKVKPNKILFSKKHK